MGFQNLVYAWAAAYLLAEEPLPLALVEGLAQHVGAQVPFAVDDVAVMTQDGNVLVVQVKVGLKLGRVGDSALARALDQAVEMFLSGTIRAPGPDERRLDPARDAIVLCTDGSAPASVADDLASAVRRVASQPPGTPLGTDLTARQDAAFRVGLDHLKRSWTAKAGIPPSEEDLRLLLKCVHILVLRLRPGEQHREAALSVLHRSLENPARASDAWAVLVGEGQAASQSREWRDRSALALTLAQVGIAVREPRLHSRDINIIKTRSSMNMVAMRTEAQLPVGEGLHIPRSVSAVLREDRSRDPILIIGDAGAGKSAIAYDLASARSTREDVVLLRASDVAGANRLHTSEPVEQVLRAWPGGPGLLVIDGVDALRGSGDRQSLSAVVEALVGTRWQVVASARTFDTRNSQPLQRAFAGDPISDDPAMFDDRLEGVRHLRVGDLSADDLDQQIVPPMPLAGVLRAASDDLRTLLRNPFNLRLAAELSEHLTRRERDGLLRIRSRVELLHRYWDYRVRGEDQYGREALIRRLVTAMVAERRLEVAIDEPTVRAEDSAALDTLLTHGVLVVVDGPIRGVGGMVTFSHNILFDYATAVHLLYRGDHTPKALVDLLDADPTLPLIARPAFDFLVDMLWESRKTGGFWPTALAVSATEHELASMAVAARIVQLAHLTDDLTGLGPDAGDPSDLTEPSPKQRLTRHLIGAMRVRAVLSDPSVIVRPAVALAHQLAAAGAGSLRNIAVATDLIITVQLRVPADEGAPETLVSDRGAVVASLLDACRSMPARAEHIAAALARQTEFLVGGSFELRQALRRLLDDEAALAQWGGSVLSWLPDSILPTLDVDPPLARRLATEPFTFVETRDEDVSFWGSAVLPMRESRKQQAEMARYRLVEVFPEVSAKDPVTASLVLCDVVQRQEDPLAGFVTDDEDGVQHDLATDAETHKEASSARTRSSGRNVEWPLTAQAVDGWLAHGYGFGLSDYAHEDEQKMFSALAEAITADPQAGADVLRVLVCELHEPWGWAALMQDPAHPAELASVLFPAFKTGTLLAHPDTFTYAAHLLASAVQTNSVNHVDAESAVLAAITLVDRHDLGPSRKELLVGCLDAKQLTAPALVTQRRALGDDLPEVPAPNRAVTTVRPYSVIDHVRGQGVEVRPELEAVARDLEHAMQLLDDRTEDLTSSLEGLAARFIEASTVFSPPDTPVQFRSVLVRAAERLASAIAVKPSTPTGRLVVEVLLDAWRSDDAGSFLS
ncbi:NACHT domain-containing protein [Georgenia satyanarayanai]|uniref:NACHT domain-containing protein n=1 Tax=Georgenia satyanarayanai TaxID=860221 RepID=UPI001264131C|nr:hypothetical protein [Georgenia satyanarayanai]